MRYSIAQQDIELQKIKNMYKSETKIEVSMHENGFILPRKFGEKSPKWGLGGVLDENRVFQEISSYHGGWIDQGGTYDFNDYDVSNDTVVYIGLFFKHWGHFLVDLTTRCWYFSYFPIDHMKVAYIGEDEIAGNYLEFFELLGIKKNQLIQITKPTKFKKILVPDHACRPCIWYSMEYQNMYNTIISNGLKKDNKIIENEKIYFSRLNFNKANQNEIGEKNISDVLEKKGFKIISPENLTLSEQISIWNRTKTIVCLNGSIPLNIIFCNNNELNLIVLNKTSIIHLNLFFYSFIKSIKAKYINVYLEPINGFPKSLGEGPFLLYTSNEFNTFFDNDVKFLNVSIIESILKYFYLIFLYYLKLFKGFLLKIINCLFILNMVKKK